MRGKEKAYKLMSEKFPHDKGRAILLAVAIGASYEDMDRYADAASFYNQAIAKLAGDKQVSAGGCVLVQLLDRLGECYKKNGDLGTAEQHFKQAIKAYDQVKGRLSLLPEAGKERSKLPGLDAAAVNMLLHFTLLLTTLQRPDDAARARQRLTTIVRGSPHLRTQEKRINLQIEDFIALEKIREERKFQAEGVVSL